MATKRTRSKTKFIQFPKELGKRIDLEAYALDGITTEELQTLTPLSPRERLLRLSYFADQAAARMGA